MPKVLFKRTLSLISVITVAAFTLSPAQAGDFEFRYQQYELASKASAAALFNRLEGRVESYCTSHGHRSLTQLAAEQACVDDMLAEMVQKIQHPYIDRMYASMTNSAA